MYNCVSDILYIKHIELFLISQKEFTDMKELCQHDVHTDHMQQHNLYSHNCSKQLKISISIHLLMERIYRW